MNLYLVHTETVNGIHANAVYIMALNPEHAVVTFYKGLPLKAHTSALLISVRLLIDAEDVHKENK